MFLENSSDVFLKIVLLYFFFSKKVVVLIFNEGNSVNDKIIVIIKELKISTKIR